MSILVGSAVLSAIALCTLWSRELRLGSRPRKILSWVTTLFIVVNLALIWWDKPVESRVWIFYQEPGDKDISESLGTALDQFKYTVIAVSHLDKPEKWTDVFGENNDPQVRYFYERDRYRADLIKLVADVSVSWKGRSQTVRTRQVTESATSNAKNGTIEIWIPAQK